MTTTLNEKRCHNCNKLLLTASSASHVVIDCSRCGVRNEVQPSQRVATVQTIPATARR